MFDTVQQESSLKGYIFTWVASVAAACVIGTAWVYTHPVQKFVTVNISSLFNESAQALALIKDESAMQQAQAQALKINQALQQLADACDCLVMNSAAIAKRPGNENQSRAIAHDMTKWVKERIGAN